MGEALKTSTSIKTLNLYDCSLSPEDGKGLAGGIAATGSLTVLDVRYNSNMGDEGKAALQAAVRGKEGFELLI